MSTNPGLVVFSDVDAALTEPAHPAVRDAVDLLSRKGVALVLCSSRTRAELEQILHPLSNPHPFVCEYGEAAFVPRGYFPLEISNARDVAGYEAIEFGRSYQTVVETLERAALRTGVPVRGFHDMSVEEVAYECRLPLLTARLAKLRDYGEFFRVLNPQGASGRLFSALEAARLHCIPGARYHFVGGTADLSLGVSTLCTLYRRAFGVARFAGITLEGGVSEVRRVCRQVEAVSDASPMGWANAVLRIAATLRRRSDIEAPTG